jgi:hypothetical protein
LETFVLSPPVLVAAIPAAAWAIVEVIYLTYTHIAIQRSGYDAEVIRALAKLRPRLRLWR